MRQLAVCAMFRNERQHLAEWLAFHLAMGVEHFYLYDNFSDDRPEEVLAPFIASGRVTLVDWRVPLVDGGQMDAYRDCLRRAQGVDRRLAFIDLDEFLFSPHELSLPSVLENYSDAAGVAVHWQGYGSSGHVDRTPGLTVERFLFRAPTLWARNLRTKCIVDPTRVTGPAGPHFFVPAGPAPLVNEKGRPIEFRHASRAARRIRAGVARLWPRAPVDPYAVREPVGLQVSVEHLRINHYAVKSLEEYREKQRRHVPPAGAGGGPRRRRYGDTFFRYHDRNDVFDPVLRPFANDIRAVLAQLG